MQISSAAVRPSLRAAGRTCLWRTINADSLLKGTRKRSYQAEPAASYVEVRASARTALPLLHAAALRSIITEARKFHARPTQKTRPEAALRCESGLNP